MTVREALKAKQVRVIGNPYPTMPFSGIYAVRGYCREQVIREKKLVMVHTLKLVKENAVRDSESSWVNIDKLELVS